MIWIESSVKKLIDISYSHKTIDLCSSSFYTQRMIQATIDIPVIYQDHHLLVVNKPAGLVIHPTYKHADGTMWDSILAYLAQQGNDNWQPEDLPDKPEWTGAPEHIQVMLREQQRAKQWQEEGLLPRPCLLHRIDKDTSGIVALARTERARRHLIRQFHDHSIVKRYLAAVRRGAPEWTRPRAPFHIWIQQANDEQLLPVASADLLAVNGATYLLNAPLQRDPADRRRCIVGPDGQSAETMVRVIAARGEYALLEARPITGRTHQIRAHLAAAGYAIVGDQTYGLPTGEETAAQLHRQFLHAYSLELRNYPDNARRIFVAPLAADLVDWLAAYLPEGLEILDAGKAVPD